MSVFFSIETGLSKSVHFLLSVFTKTSAVLAVLQKVSPQTLSALLAVFYDVMKFVAEGGQVAALLQAGNPQAALGTVLSATTQILLTQIAADLQTGEKVIVDDLNELGIAIKTPTPTAAA